MKCERDYLREYLNHLVVERGLSKNTIDAYHNDLDQFYAFLEKSKISCLEVSVHTIIDFLTALESYTAGKPATLARKTSAIRGFYQHLLTEKLIDENPCDVLEKAKAESRLPEVLTIAEVDRLLSAPDLTTKTGYRDLAMLEVLYATGLRVSELIGLNLGDIDAMGFVRCLGKGNKERIVPIGSKALAAVQTYIQRCRGKLVKNRRQRALFVNARGTRITRQGFGDPEPIQKPVWDHETPKPPYPASFICNPPYSQRSRSAVSAANVAMRIFPQRRFILI